MSSVQSGIRKLHFVYMSKDWDKSKPQHERKSNNYLVYVRHWDYPDSFMLLAIIAPNAHETIDRALPALTDMAEEFNALNREDLSNLTWY